MTKKWTIESAKAYVTKVQRGKQQAGLTYCSAMDFLTKNGSSMEKMKVEQNDTTSDSN